MKPTVPALRASSASMRSDSWRSRASTLWREIAASETQPTAVLRDSKAVNSTMSGFESGSLRATNYCLPAVDRSQAFEEEIHHFLVRVVGPEPENREVLQKVLAELTSRERQGK